MSYNPNDPALKSWVETKTDTDFPIQNLPYGIFKTNASEPHVGVAIGAFILDLSVIFQAGLFNNLGIKNTENIFAQSSLNKMIACGPAFWKKLRLRISELLNVENTEIQGNHELKQKALILQNEAQMLLPVEVPDYTDFYSSLEHASNVGKMFRPTQDALLPNWKHIPVGYHGRASSIFVSGTDFHRPKGQMLPLGAERPIFGPSKQLDLELETAFIVGQNTNPGDSVSVENAQEIIFGMVLFNDWSARDIQSWEYVPLGPFLGKNFASTSSAWVVSMEALYPFKTAGPVQEPEVQDYLKFTGPLNYDIELEVYLKPENGEENLISHSNHKYLYWNMFQQLAHHTINGCNLRVGDMCGSGTISAPVETGFGSMLELTWRGSKPITLKDGSERKFLEDGDSIIIKGYCIKDGLRIGFGKVEGKILPAK